MTFKYKIEVWDNEFSGDPFYVAFVARHSWFGRTAWDELGRYETKAAAEARLRLDQRPQEGPYLYTEDALG